MPPPSHLGPDAAKEWKRMITELAALKLVTTLDLSLLAAWCTAVGDYVEAERALRKDGLLITDRDGTIRRSPMLMVRNKAIELMRQLGGEFGFSPASRNRVVAARPSDNRQPGDGMTLEDFLATDPDIINGRA
jgi:P27 family predicted phage terminase small subunit